MTTIIDYAFLGMLEISNEMQNPLGWNKSDLPLEEYCRFVQLNLKRMADIAYNRYGIEYTATELPNLGMRTAGLQKMRLNLPKRKHAAEDDDDDG